MLQRVREQRPSYNNDQRIAANLTISSLKLLYYRIFASVFTAVGFYPLLVMVNSSWTSNHICSLWHLTKPSKPKPRINTTAEEQQTATANTKNASPRIVGRELVLIYPPCNTSHLLQNIELSRPARFSLRHASHSPLYSKEVEKAVDLAAIEQKMLVMSVGQFRPEKDHFLQIE